MPPFDATTVADPATTSDRFVSSQLSASQIASLIKTVAQALARGQSVTIMSEGRMLARYLPTPTGEEEAGQGRGDAGRGQAGPAR